MQSADGPAYAVYPAAWSNRHRGRLFAPPVGPLTLHENIVWITVRPGAKVGHKVRLVETAPSGRSPRWSPSPLPPGPAAGRDCGLTRRKDGGWIVTGSIGVRASSRRLTAVASDPKVVLNAVWGAALAKAGIIWNRAPTPGLRRPKVSRRFWPKWRRRRSTRSRARSTAAASISAPSCCSSGRAAGIGPTSALTQHVREVIGSTEGVYLADGSGLSYDDRVAPSAFITYLAKFPATAAGQNFPQLLPANGTGTLRRLNTGFPGEGVVRAKTGTLGQVSTVVGYLGTDERRAAGLADVQRAPPVGGAAGAVEAVPGSGRERRRHSDRQRPATAGADGRRSMTEPLPNTAAPTP